MNAHLNNENSKETQMYTLHLCFSCCYDHKDNICSMDKKEKKYA